MSLIESEEQYRAFSLSNLLSNLSISLIGLLSIFYEDFVFVFGYQKSGGQERSVAFAIFAKVCVFLSIS